MRHSFDDRKVIKLLFLQLFRHAERGVWSPKISYGYIHVWKAGVVTKRIEQLRVIMFFSYFLSDLCCFLNTAVIFQYCSVLNVVTMDFKILKYLANNKFQ